MEHSIKDFSDKQIEELKQYPGIKIDADSLFAEVSFMAEGLFLSISKNVSGYNKKVISTCIEEDIPNTEHNQITNDIDDTETVYTAEELRLLEGVSPEGLAKIDKVKGFFGGKVVEDIEPAEDNSNKLTAIKTGKHKADVEEQEIEPTAEESCECGSRAIPYVNSSDKHILNKCNVHGARLKVTHADIDAWSREKERNRHSNTEGDDQSKRPVEVKKY